MKIEIALKKSQLKNLPPRSYKEEEDDIRSILIDICHFTGDQVDFNISGFGQDSWPVDTKNDLPVFLEQLPQAINAIKNRNTANIDFYEQGIERYLTISQQALNNMCQISCASHTNWKPCPEIESIHATELLKMLVEAKNVFMSIAMTISPSVAMHPWMAEWNNA